MIDPDILFTGMCRAGIDLKVRQIGVLLACTAEGKRSPGSREVRGIAEHLGLHKSAVTRNCDRLADLEMIERVPVSGDGRLCVVAPTAAGRAMAEQIRGGMREQAAGREAA